MPLWELIAQLCKTVVDNQNVFLEISLTEAGCMIQLVPMAEWEEDDDDSWGD